ncbi:MAG: diguanylate cyclase, partial [Lachnospiraceae bacterium]|nr:diguanylate cyclase [Lachnospiraceae bacterium]
MENKLKTRLEYLGKVNVRLTIAFVVAIVSVFVLLSVSAYLLYVETKENIEHVGQIRALQASQTIKEYLQTGVDAVELAAYRVENMLESNIDATKIEAYMERQSDEYSLAISENYNGIYGLIKGNYLDGTGWNPGKDFDATQRVWYRKAMKNEGVTTLITPYKDAMTGSSIMSISKRLTDGESVIAMDLTMDGLLALKTGMTIESDADNYFFLLDENSRLIEDTFMSAVKQKSEVTPTLMAREIAKKLKKLKKAYFGIRIEEKEYFVFAEPLKKQWHSVYVINRRELFNGLLMVEVFVAIMMSLFAFLAIVVVHGITKRQREREELNMQLTALTDIYNSMYSINVKTNRISKITGGVDDSGNLLAGSREHADDILNMMMEFYCAEESRKPMKDFINFETLSERLKSINTITMEFLNHKDCWCRARFVVAERKINGKPQKLMWLIEKIDEEKRRRDYLKHLAEIDRMSGILNRTSGENRIRELLKECKNGMFVLLDVDRFKRINDNFGHAVGDSVIVNIALCLKESAMPNDIVLRLGGDEFAAYAPDVK